jgi:CheY-like chemotaxis protein
MIDYRAYPVLYVDDERANLVSVQYALGNTLEILTASSGEEALRILGENAEIAVLLCDQKMPDMDGVAVCEAARRIRPDAIRIMITAYSDLHAAIEAINRGQVSRYVRKPFQNEDLIEILRTAIDLVHLQRTVHGMEVRLLSIGPKAGAEAATADLARELAELAASMRENVERSSTLLTSATASIEESPAVAREALTEMRALTESIRSDVGRLDGITDRLDGSGTALTSEAHCYLDRVVDSTAGILRTEIQRVAHLKIISDGSPRVRMDPSSLGQVVMSLLLNAAQAVHGKPRDEAHITVRITERDDRALLAVSDDGPARERDDSVLGLVVVKEMVARAGGTVSSASDERGSSFTVELPLRPGSSHPPASR